MDALLKTITIAVLVMSAVQVFFVLIRNWQQVNGATQRQTFQLEIFKEQLARASMMRNSEQIALDSSWSGFRKFKIAQKVQEGGDICSFYLSPHDGKPLPSFYPGQHLTFSVKNSGSVKPSIRCYSLSDSPSQTDYYRVSIKLASPPASSPDLSPGVVSSFFHQSLKEGDIVDVKSPSGSFHLDMDKRTPVVLISGGVGITPMLSMLNALVDINSKREIWFFYGVSDGSEHIQVDHLRSIDAEYENIQLHVCYSRPRDEDQLGVDYHHAERVSVEVLRRLLPSNNYDFYLCGPSSMMASMNQGLDEWGVPENRVHFEAFGPASVKAQQPKIDTEKVSLADQECFDVTFSRSGKTVKWSQSEGSLLEFAESQGVSIDSGCRAGSCGTCVTALKSGNVVYQDDSVEEPEKGSCLICVAQPKSDVVLDA